MSVSGRCLFRPSSLGASLPDHSRALEEERNGTRLCWTMRFDSAEEVERIRESIVPANEQNLDRLGTQLAAGYHD